MKRMLINATQPEELRVALVDGQKLYDLDIETPSREQKKSNIYKGRITRVEPSLEAAFVQYGSERHGFLPFKEIAHSYYSDNGTGNGRASIKDVIREGQEVVVQIDKEERGTKGAALTTYISLAGRYLVLMPNNPKAGGVSRRIEGEERDEIREALRQLETPEGAGLIVRTAGVGRNIEELQWDLNYLLQLWDMIQKAADERPAPFLIYQESNVIIRALRDYLRQDTGEILIDDPVVYRQAQDFVQQVMPHNMSKLKLYQDTVPLFTRYQIESQIESAFDRQVQLPSGGAIVIDHTEALISIDINSARATKGSDIEETALNTNLEAAEEIARQLRIRDLGGLIVIDFIDMGPNRNQREVENRLRDAVKMDRARVQLGRISRFGLLEMSRQRLRTSLGEASQEVCARCSGQGTVRGVESLALSVLRIVEEEAMKEKTAKVMAQLPIDVATFLLNEKRAAVNMVEERHNVQVLLIPNRTLETPHYSVQRIRGDDSSADDTSYRLVAEAAEEELPTTVAERPRAEEPAVKALSPAVAPPPPAAVAAKQPESGETAGAGTPTATASAGNGLKGFFRWLTTIFSAGDDRSTEDSERPSSARGQSAADDNNERRSRRRSGQQGDQGASESRRGNGRGRRRGGRNGRQQTGDNDQNKRSGSELANEAPANVDGAKRGGQTQPVDSSSEAGRSRKQADSRPDKAKDLSTKPQDEQPDNREEPTAEGQNQDAQSSGTGSGRGGRRGRRGGRRRRRSSTSGEQISGEQGTETQPSDQASDSDKTAGAETGTKAANQRAAESESAPERDSDSPKAHSTKAADGESTTAPAAISGSDKPAASADPDLHDPRMRRGRPRIPARTAELDTPATEVKAEDTPAAIPDKAEVDVVENPEGKSSEKATEAPRRRRRSPERKPESAPAAPQEGLQQDLDVESAEPLQSRDDGANAPESEPFMETVRADAAAEKIAMAEAQPSQQPKQPQHFHDRDMIPAGRAERIVTVTPAEKDGESTESKDESPVPAGRAERVKVEAPEQGPEKVESEAAFADDGKATDVQDNGQAGEAEQPQQADSERLPNQ